MPGRWLLRRLDNNGHGPGEAKLINLHGQGVGAGQVEDQLIQGQIAEIRSRRRLQTQTNPRTGPLAFIGNFGKLPQIIKVFGMDQLERPKAKRPCLWHPVKSC